MHLNAEPTCSFAPPTVFEAKTYIRRMCGGSQPSLVKCSDGHLYVIKFLGNQQGSNVLANEVLGNELLTAIGLPTATWKPIWVSDQFIDENPNICFETLTGRTKITAGAHFGSRFLGQEQAMTLLEHLPSGFHNRIVNKQDFVGVYIFDLWANHCDSRQSIFLRDEETGSLRPFFIDNGHLFGGPNWELVSRKGEALFRDIEVYPSEWLTGAIEYWISHIRNCIENGLAEAVMQIPPSWFIGDIGAFQNNLMTRLRSLNQIVRWDLTQNKRLKRVQSNLIDDAVFSIHPVELLSDRSLNRGPTALALAGA
jgi:hypothetical protein